MTLAKDFEDFVKLLNKHQVNYMVVGGYALAFHGKPRHTGDLDIWINNSKENAEKLVLAIIHNSPLPPPHFPATSILPAELNYYNRGRCDESLNTFNSKNKAHYRRNVPW
jgi:hypothetical protein